ncbi:hypothetical protein [Archangium sp.]|jgi:hypothetical protein|uniref:hypothetical protein n=1 Tax=Archangium sp. TaxID=1872627 RepID=UPI002EDABBB6
MNPRRSFQVLASVALLAVGGLLGLHIYRLETRLASLEASAERRGTPEGQEGATSLPVPPARQGLSQPEALPPTRRGLRLDEGAARRVASRLGDQLGLEATREERLARFLMAFYLREALTSARAQGEDVSESEASYPELLRGDLKQELLALRLTPAQLATLSRETPGLDALLSR